MVQLTEQAAQELKKIRDEVQEQHPGSVPRLFQSGEGEFTVTIGLPVEGDRELYYADEKVLIVAPETSRIMTNFTLDYKDTPQGHKFVIIKGRAE
jgi:Fe-S cluster assembly iron-binding protein IscA